VGASPRRATKGEGAARRVLGVDPGTVCTGWGVIEDLGRSMQYVASGVIRPKGSRPDRLAMIHQALHQICRRFGPEAVVIEQTFVGHNIQTAFRLGEARGAVMVAAAQAGRAVAEYSPAEIKVAVAGNGRATKQQMQAMVERLLRLAAPLATDEADALGAAICHLHTHRFLTVVAASRAATSGAGAGAAIRLP